MTETAPCSSANPRGWKRIESPGHCPGFTLVEFAILAALVAIVVAIAVPMLDASEEAAKIAAAIGDIRAIETQIHIFEMANERLPLSLNEVGMGNRLDPWNNPYQYQNFVLGNAQVRRDGSLRPINTSYDLYSVGKDGDSKPPLSAAPSRDDIVRANDGAFVGLAKDY